MSLDNARKLLDAALASEEGVTVKFPDLTTAKAVRNCCYTVRKRDRAANTKQFPGVAAYANKSEWDGLAFKLDEVALTLAVVPEIVQWQAMEIINNATGEKITDA